MGLNEVDDYFREDTDLQNYTKTGVKRIINPFIFQNDFLLTSSWCSHKNMSKILKIHFSRVVNLGTTTKLC